MNNILILNAFNYLLPRTALIVQSLNNSEYHTDIINWHRIKDLSSAQPTRQPQYALVLPLTKNIFKSAWVVPALYRQIRRIFKRSHYEFIYCNHVLFLPIAVWLAAWSKTKVIYDISEFYIDNFRQKLPKPLRFFANILAYIEMCCVKYTHGVFIIDSLDQFLEKHYQRYAPQVRVLNNVPDKIAVQDENKKRIIEEKYQHRPVILYIGGLSYENGAYVTLVAARKVLQSFPHALFLFIGRFNSNLTEEIFNNVIKEQGLKNSIELIPWIPYSELFCYAQAVDVGLAPYQRSLAYAKVGATNSRKTFSYMKMGIPIIAPSFGQQGEVIKDEKCGVLVDTQNACELANGIIYLLSNPQEAQRMGMRGRCAFLEKYNWHEEEKKITALLTHNKDA